MQNPLLDISGLPRFAAIRPEHVKPALDTLLADNRRALEQLLAVERRYTWDNFAQPIEDMKERLARLWSPVSHLNGVLNSDALRAVYNENLPRLSEYYTELAQDERLYAGYKAIAASPEYAQLTTAQKKSSLTRCVISVLPAPSCRRTKGAFQGNPEAAFPGDEPVFRERARCDPGVGAVDHERSRPHRPAGVRARWRSKRRNSRARPAGASRSKGPSYIAFMTYADVRELRRQMYEAFVTRASEVGPHAGRWDNGELIPTILKLRTEAAALLGYPNYAEYALQTRMAKSVSEVMQFLRDLARRARPAAQQEFEELKRFAHEQHGVATLEAWDVAYYSEKLRQQRYAISQEDLRPYLPETRVVPGMFEVVRRLYGLDIRERRGVEVWHPAVRFFEIRDSAGELRGRFYMDLYARQQARRRVDGRLHCAQALGRRRAGTGGLPGV